MQEPALFPEVCVDLKIQLDRLARANDQCRAALMRVSAGKMTLEEYGEHVRRQRSAQIDWERKNRDYHLSSDA